MSQRSRNAALAVLRKHYTHVNVSILNNLSDLESLVALNPDLVFLGMEFVPADEEMSLRGIDKVWLSDYLDEYNIAYTGSSQRAHELGRDKALAKQRALDKGLNTSSFYVVRQNQSLTEPNNSLKFPLFVKPTNRGGGLGIDSNSVVHNFAQLQAKIQSIATDFQSDSLIEEYLPGREFSVAILRDRTMDTYSVMPIELVAPPNNKSGARFLSAEVKSSNTEQVIPVTDIILKMRVTDLALSIFYALGARDYGRIDIRLDKSGTPHFLEVNPIPSLIEGYGSFPKACMLNIGMDYETMLLHIVKLGLSRGSHVPVSNIESIATADVTITSLEPALDTV